MKEIKGFVGNYRWLSNFWASDVWYENQKFPSVEAAYQAAKTLDLEIRKLFWTMVPSEAKHAGRGKPFTKLGKTYQLVIREDWEEVKFGIMEHLIRQKFAASPTLRRLLLDTGDAYLEETNWWHDTFWGVCNGRGHNYLGKILMAVRQELGGK